MIRILTLSSLKVLTRGPIFLMFPNFYGIEESRGISFTRPISNPALNYKLTSIFD